MASKEEVNFSLIHTREEIKKCITVGVLKRRLLTLFPLGFGKTMFLGYVMFF